MLGGWFENSMKRISVSLCIFKPPSERLYSICAQKILITPYIYIFLSLCICFSTLNSQYYKEH